MPEIFSVVVLYEDRETRDRVLGFSHHLPAQVGDEVELKFSWWRFDFLRDSKLAEEAANAALVADMLIISAHPDRGLPPAFTEWIESWLPRRSYRESALVALIGSEADPSEHAASNYLRGIATRARMDYLARPQAISTTDSGNLTDSLLQQAETTTPLLENIPKEVHPPSHWGINE